MRAADWRLVLRVWLDDYGITAPILAVCAGLTCAGTVLSALAGQWGVVWVRGSIGGLLLMLIWTEVQLSAARATIRHWITVRTNLMDRMTGED